ncbi:MAG: hypothetical protein QCH35_06900 [Methanomicrobiaceae archaeon]|nr:hypothetical protein [Methanomicrobiaceae archaeon]
MPSSTTIFGTPLQVIVGLTLLHLEDEGMAENILEQAGVINDIVHRLDRGWIGSKDPRLAEKVLRI